MEMEGERNHYSICAWTVKPGREDDFRTAWNDFAQWTAESKTASEGVLVQDTEDPRRFYCFWPFESEEAIARWRSGTLFRQHMMRLRAFCADCRPSIVKLVDRI